MSDALPRTAILTGPTASGKSSLAIELAQAQLGLEIINADSLLVYRGMNIGTAKPTSEERQGVPHHLIDIRDPNETFTAGQFVREVEALLADIHSRGNRALIVGGTGFYLKGLLFGLWDAPASDPVLRDELSQKDNAELYRKLEARDPASAQRIGPRDRYRLIRALELIQLSGKTPTELEASQPKTPDPRFVLWILDRPDEELRERIERRTRAMLEAGLIEETENLRKSFPEARALQSIGYAQVQDYQDGTLPAGRKLKPGLTGLHEEIALATRQLVKSQRTWFKSLAKQVELKRFILDSERETLEKEFHHLYG